jgi:hypothetical protein
MNKWKFCVVSPQDAVLTLCGGKLDKGNGCSFGGGDGDGRGYGFDWGDGWGDGFNYYYGISDAGGGHGCSRGDDDGGGSSPEVW